MLLATISVVAAAAAAVVVTTTVEVVAAGPVFVVALAISAPLAEAVEHYLVEGD